MILIIIKFFENVCKGRNSVFFKKDLFMLMNKSWMREVFLEMSEKCLEFF